MRVLALTVLCVCLLAGVHPPAAAQSVVIEGEVLDALSRLPLAGALLQFGDSVTVLSDSLGYFRAEVDQVALTNVRVRRTGYLAFETSVQTDQALLLTVILDPAPFALPGLKAEVASAVMKEWRRSGHPVDLISAPEVDEIRDRAFRVLDVIRMKGPPRLRIKEKNGARGTEYCVESTRPPPSLARGAGRSCNQALIVLDGIVIGAPSAGIAAMSSIALSEILNLHPEEIETVRFMSPMEAQFRWGRSEGRFGALIIETRRGG
jgi:hypothetical protein